MTGFLLFWAETAASEQFTTLLTEPDGFPGSKSAWNLDYTPGGVSGEVQRQL